MLPKELNRIKEQLNNRRSLSNPERILLGELTTIDSDKIIEDRLKDSDSDIVIDQASPKRVAPPSGRCPCCGQKL